MSSDQQVDIIFPTNQEFYQPYSLNITQEGLRTLADLRKSISRRLYLHPNCITIKHQQNILTDDTLPLSNLDLHHYRQILAFVTEPVETPIPNPKQLVIAGLDFTNVKIVQELFGMKSEERKGVSANTAVQVNGKEEGEIDFKVKYGRQLSKLKSQLQSMGMNKNEDDLLALLISNGGSFELAVNAVFDQPS